MANLLVNIDLRAGVPTSPSIFALQTARAIASEFGATVVATIITGTLALPDLERLARVLGDAGADRALVCSDAAFAGPPFWTEHGRVLRLVTETLRPRIVLFPAGTTSAQMAPPLAAFLAATLLPHASCEITRHPDRESRLHIVRRTPKWEGLESTDVLASTRPIVAILKAGKPASLPPGSVEAELELLPVPTANDPPIGVLSSREDVFDAPLSVPTLFVLTTDIEAAREKIPAALPNGAALIRNTPDHPAGNLDVACPETLFVLSEQSLPNPPPVMVSARGSIALCGPRKPPGTRFPGVYLRTDLATPDQLIEELAAGSNGAIPS